MMSPLFLVTSTIIMTAAAESATSASSSICYENPRQDICSSFIHPNSTTDMDNLCKAMPYMTGCSVSKKCRDSPGFLPEEYCKPFSVIADVCAADMPGMGGW